MEVGKRNLKKVIFTGMKGGLGFSRNNICSNEVIVVATDVSIVRTEIDSIKSEIMKMRYVFYGLILSMLLVFNSCKEDDIEDAESELPNGEVEGDQRDRFLGTWTVSETSKLLGSRNFDVNVSKDDQFPAQVNISNFHKIGSADTIVATISAVLVDVITITDQTVASSFYTGSGKMENDQKISLSYTVDDGNANIDTVTAVLIR
ncbi:MAG: hypothetical protein ACJA0Q_000983 [Saprospiraceae bacterium]